MKNLHRSPAGTIPALALIVTGILALAFYSGCTTGTGEAEGVGVAVTIPPVADFVQNVGGEHVSVTVMVPAGASPHTHEPTPSQMSKIAGADVYFKVGSGIEFELVWLDNLTAQNRDMEVVDCSTGIGLRDNDPHIWTSPLNTITMVETIAEGLASIDPPRADIYRQNGQAYAAELRTLHEEIEEMLSGPETRHFLVYHPSFGYFAADYNLVQMAIEREGKATTAQTLQRTIDRAIEHNLEYVFVEPQFATAEAESIADALGGQTVAIDPLPRSYIPGMRSVAEAISLELE